LLNSKWRADRRSRSALAGAVGALADTGDERANIERLRLLRHSPPKSKATANCGNSRLGAGYRSDEMTRVTLYMRSDCSLCETAREAIRASGVPVELSEVDIDEDAALRARYTDDVPVIFVDGREAFRHRVTPQQFAEYVRDPRAPEPPPELATEKCVPCRGGVPPLHGEELQTLAKELGGGWTVVREHHLEKSFPFPDFASGLAFTNAVGAVAEAEGHHPDIHLAWGSVRITIWTHKIDGLTRSDFVLAAKIGRVR